MKTTMVRYKTFVGRAEENAALVRAVYAELRAQKPAGFHYATHQLSDGVSFVHIAVLANGHESPLQSLPAFQAFIKDIRSRCEEPPVVSELNGVDSFGWFGDSAS